MLLLEFVLCREPARITHSISDLLLELHSLPSLIVDLLGELVKNQHVRLLVLKVVQQVYDLLVLVGLVAGAVELELVEVRLADRLVGRLNLVQIRLELVQCLLNLL